MGKGSHLPVTHLTASPCIFVAVCSQQQLFCTQQPPQPSSPHPPLTIIVFPSSAAERANRERERKWVREISSTAVPWPPGLSGQNVGIIYSKVYPFHGDNEWNQTKRWQNEKVTFWNLLSLHEVFFYCLTGSLEKQISTEPTAWPSVCVSVCLYVCLVCQSHI